MKKKTKPAWQVKHEENHKFVCDSLRAGKRFYTVARGQQVEVIGVYDMGVASGIWVVDINHNHWNIGGYSDSFLSSIH